MQARRALQRLAGDIDSDHAGSRAVELRAERPSPSRVEHTLSRCDVARAGRSCERRTPRAPRPRAPLPDGLVVSARAHERTRLERTDQPRPRGAAAVLGKNRRFACRQPVSPYQRCTTQYVGARDGSRLQIDRADPGVRVAFDTVIGAVGRCRPLRALSSRSLATPALPPDELLETERPPRAAVERCRVLHSRVSTARCSNSPCRWGALTTVGLKAASEHLRGGVERGCASSPWSGRRA